MEANWLITTDRDWDAIALYKRHYSARHYRDARANLRSKGFLGPGEKMVLITSMVDALFCWVYSKLGHKNGQKGVYCTVFRNEGSVLSSELIREAVEIAQKRWPGKRMFTYINAQKIRSTNPGYCFLKAGWKHCGYTKGLLIILELTPAERNYETLNKRTDMGNTGRRATGRGPKGLF